MEETMSLDKRVRNLTIKKFVALWSLSLGGGLGVFFVLGVLIPALSDSIGPMQVVLISFIPAALLAFHWVITMTWQSCRNEAETELKDLDTVIETS
jgi:hypothetical protein